ncbi:MAG: flippase-like domain-containing protein [Chloroflexi bacterium]|nr:flippase-like domain-containing protein [Chloroflexota bacterium]
MIRTSKMSAPTPPAERAAVAVPAEEDERSVDLGRRFFNAKTLASFLFGVAIIVTLFRVTSIHPDEIWQQLRQVDGRIYALAALSYCLTFPVRGFRWQRLLQNVGPRLPVLHLTEVIFLSWFVNSVLPGKVGDIYRGYLLRREYGVSFSRTVGTVVAERVVDLMGLILLLGTTGYLVLRHRVSPLVDQMLFGGWIGLAALVIGMLLIYRFGERLVSFFPDKVQANYTKFAHGTFSSLKNPPVLGVLTLLAWAAEAGRLYFVMQALHVGIGPLAALFTVAAISLALIVPTPGGLGGVEAAFVGVLAVFGIPLQLALAVALLDRLISYYSLIAFGLPAFLLTRRGK